MSESVQFVVFRLDKQRYALSLAAVERVVRAAEVTLLPNAPPIVLGAIDVGGRVLPVFNVRRDRKSTRLNSSHIQKSRMPSSA